MDYQRDQLKNKKSKFSLKNRGALFVVYSDKLSEKNRVGLEHSGFSDKTNIDLFLKKG